MGKLWKSRFIRTLYKPSLPYGRGHSGNGSLFPNDDWPNHKLIYVRSSWFTRLWYDGTDLLWTYVLQSNCMPIGYTVTKTIHVFFFLSHGSLQSNESSGLGEFADSLILGTITGRLTSCCDWYSFHNIADPFQVHTFPFSVLFTSVVIYFMQVP